MHMTKKRQRDWFNTVILMIATYHIFLVIFFLERVAYLRRCIRFRHSDYRRNGVIAIRVGAELRQAIH